MPSYVTPKKNTAYVTYVSLVDQSNTKLHKSTPTLAAGDFKVSIDGGTLNNLATLPTNTPASSKMVKISLSADEMNGDVITVVCSDASGAEWADLTLVIATSAQQIDDLASQASVNTIDDFLDTEIAAIKAKTDNLPTDPADASDIATSFTSLNTKVDTIDDFLDTEIAAIKAKTDNLPSDPADDSDIDTQLAAIAAALDVVDNFLDTEIAAIKAKTDNLPADPADDSDIDAQLAAIAGYIDTEVAAVLAAVDTEIAAIKAKTDNLPAAPAASGDIPTVAQILTTAMTEAYPTLGATMTLAQALYAIHQWLTEKSISGTTVTTKKRDRTTTAKTYTLNSATTPTSTTEAS